MSQSAVILAAIIFLVYIPSITSAAEGDNDFIKHCPGHACPADIPPLILSDTKIETMIPDIVREKELLEKEGSSPSFGPGRRVEIRRAQP